MKKEKNKEKQKEKSIKFIFSFFFFCHKLSKLLDLWGRPRWEWSPLFLLLSSFRIEGPSNSPTFSFFFLQLFFSFFFFYPPKNKNKNNNKKWQSHTLPQIRIPLPPKKNNIVHHKKNSRPETNRSNPPSCPLSSFSLPRLPKVPHPPCP